MHTVNTAITYWLAPMFFLVPESFYQEKLWEYAWKQVLRSDIMPNIPGI